MGPIRDLVLFLQGVLCDRTELAAANLALRQQLAILQQKSKTPRLRKRIGSSGRCYLGSGRIGVRPCSSCSRTPWLDGIGKASGCSGGGSREENPDAQGSKPRFAS